MNGQTLYTIGSTPTSGLSTWFMVALIAATGVCAWQYVKRRRAGTLSPETRVVLMVLAACLLSTIAIGAVSIVPDLLRPPMVERGRVLKVYSRIVDPESSDPQYRVTLSNGADLIIPKDLSGKLQLGTCVEMTHTPATYNLLVAKQIAPDVCLNGQ